MDYGVKRRTLEDLIDHLSDAIREKALDNFDYNAKENVIRGVVQPEDLVDTAYKNGVAEGLNRIAEYSSEDAVKMAVAILTAANCHREAAAVMGCAGDMVLT